MINNYNYSLNGRTTHAPTPATPYPLPSMPNPISTASHPSQTAHKMQNQSQVKDEFILNKLF